MIFNQMTSMSQTKGAQLMFCNPIVKLLLSDSNF